MNTDPFYVLLDVVEQYIRHSAINSNNLEKALNNIEQEIRKIKGKV